MPRYQRVENIVQLALALQAARNGLCLEDIQERFEVGRRTAERMRETVARLFPQMTATKADDGRKYWRLPPGAMSALFPCTRSEIVALERAVERAAREGRRQEQRDLQALLDKLCAVGEPRLHGRGDPGRSPNPHAAQHQRETSEEVRPAPLGWD